MGLCSLSSQTAAITSFPLSFHDGFAEKAFGYLQFVKLPVSKGCLRPGKFRPHDLRTQVSVTCTPKLSSARAEVIPEAEKSKDENLAFVAGATGRVGSRTVRELLKLGFKVRAGVRSAQKAETLVQSVKEMKLNIEDKGHAIEKLEIVECNLEDYNQIGPVLGNASVVICCIGASEKEVFDITGPYRIDYQATKHLIDAATVAKVNHFILVSSLGTNKVGFPAAILNLFWGVLIWKRKAEEALIASGLPYTIVRPGGMERPTDAFKETHNITLSQEDTLFGGLVSNLQVAELMAVMARNPELSYCKVVEVIAETNAPLTPMEELLTKIPSKRVPPKVPLIGGQTNLAPSTRQLSEAPESVTTKENSQEMSAVRRPQSPYTVYEDLKPPTTPTPNSSTTTQAKRVSDVVSSPAATEQMFPAGQINLMESSSANTEMNVPETELKKPRPLSPYTAYDDLKPPTSPSPSAPNASSFLISSSSIGSQTIMSSNTTAQPPTEDKLLDEQHHAEPKLRLLSPFPIYDDLKPPTSPSPSAPNSSSSLMSSSNGGSQTITSSNSTAQPPSEDKLVDEQHHTEPKQRPLSPFTMYEDLKPPSSPSPSPRQFP